MFSCVFSILQGNFIRSKKSENLRKTNVMEKDSELDLLSSTNKTVYIEEDSDDIQDWSLISKLAPSTSSLVPKRGEKDFEPVQLNESQQSSKYDVENLINSRNLMYDALVKRRGLVSSLNNLVSSTIYIDTFNTTCQCYMKKPKGKFLESLGKIDREGTCWFNFEEALYLVERGSCVSRLKNDLRSDDEESELPPLPLETVYSLLIKQSSDYNRFQVYSLLKRNGYIVLRNPEFNGEINLRDDDDYSVKLSKTKFCLWRSISSFITQFFSIRFSTSYRSIFSYLRSLIAKPPSCKVSINSQITEEQLNKQYVIAFDVWKPTPSFKKNSPPAPDFQVVVVDIRTPFPSIIDIKSLLKRSYTKPFTPKPKKGRQRHNKPANLNWDDSKGINMNNFRNGAAVMVAVVDNGLVNFYSLSQCDFELEGVCWRESWIDPKGLSNRNYKNSRRSKQGHKEKIESRDDTLFNQMNRSTGGSGWWLSFPKLNLWKSSV